ncbi:MAG: diguanylate cyclase [Lachnospiraceae bacterium]|nr:diguanylate cyclase [Lachnospiraceae bacterium]
MQLTKEKKKGISLRVLDMALIIVSVIMSAVMIFFTFQMTNTFTRMSEATEEHIQLEKAAHELMDASDYLTENVQRFTVEGDRRFMDAYFEEAFVSYRREQAIEKMNVDERTVQAAKELQEALDSSMELMRKEYYAMRLVIDAKGITDYPEILDSVTLTPEDAALSPEEKMNLATKTVLNEDYYEMKDRIRADMQESLDEVDTLTYETESAELAKLKNELLAVRVIILLQVLSIMLMVWLTSRMGINPILTAVDRIRTDKPIPEVGANEFRYLAHAYNKMYAAYRSSLSKLNFKASHDEMTGAYNRSGYELLLSSIDLTDTYMMLFDVDNFKSINDTYGHEAGDKALIRFVQVLKNAFRDDDYICRIGGDEFVVFMVHSGEIQHKQIAAKIDQINKELETTEPGTPQMTISVGIGRGVDASDPEKLFEKIDSAMYESKKHGKHTYTFAS